MPWYAWLIWGAVQLAVILWVAGISGKVREAAKAREEDGRLEKLIRLYQQIEEMLDSFEEYVGEVHEQLETQRAELIELNRQAQVTYVQSLDLSKHLQAGGAIQTAPAEDHEMEDPGFAVVPASKANVRRGGKRGEAPAARDVLSHGARPSKAAKATAAEANQKPSRLTDKDKEALGRFATKAQKVRFLMSRGLALEEVARELNIGKGEVLLITDLDKT